MLRWTLVLAAIVTASPLPAKAETIKTITGIVGAGTNDSAIGDQVFITRSKIGDQIFAKCKMGDFCEVKAAFLNGSIARVIEVRKTDHPIYFGFWTENIDEACPKDLSAKSLSPGEMIFDSEKHTHFDGECVINKAELVSPGSWRLSETCRAGEGNASMRAQWSLTLGGRDAMTATISRPGSKALEPFKLKRCGAA